MHTRRGLPRVGAAALVIFIALAGCTTTQEFSRADRSETLQLDTNWYRLPDKEGGQALFRARHERVDLELRVQQMASPIALDAAPTWTRAWLRERYSTPEISDERTARVSGYPALRFTATIASPTLRFEFMFLNGGGATYVLELWGNPSAFASWDGRADDLINGFDLPAGQEPTSLACGEDDKTVRVSTLSVTLPAGVTDGPQYCDVWSTEGGGERANWSLDSRLISGLVRTEKLPYEISAQKYQNIFLERAAPDGKGVEIIAARKEFTTVRMSRDSPSVPMTDTYVFLTRGQRGWMVQVSTPTALIPDNQTILDAILESIHLEAAG